MNFSLAACFSVRLSLHRILVAKKENNSALAKTKKDLAKAN
jgi:hypothetical protein